MPTMKIAEFGNPVLRQKAKPLTKVAIKSAKTQRLIADMRETLLIRKLGVGLAAPQVGESIALAVVAIRSSKRRPHAKPFDLVIINPEITEYHGRRIQLYEGCISAGGSKKSGLYAKVPRYKSIKLKYQNMKGQSFHEKFEDLTAQVLQHEVDHLNGVLFVDRVQDTKSYVTHSEYLKLLKHK